MSLPILTTLSEITSLSVTVYPFLHQLSLSHLLPLLRREVNFTEWYLSTNPFISGLHFSLFFSVVVLVASETNRNYSQVDRLWSLLPPFYIAHFTTFAHMRGLETERLDTLAMFGCLWGARLTFNYWRKGGYSIGSEDYRWNILKAKIPKPGFLVLNVLFISLFQNILLYLIATPAYIILLVSQLPADIAPAWNTIDLIFSRGLILVLIAEAFADQQQWNFQSAKSAYQATGIVPPKFEKEDLDRGFVVTGLWSLSRHPNFAAEQTIWVAVYMWSCYVADVMYSWVGVGALVYCALFQGSTIMTEWITESKYPEYKEYQMRVNKFIPGPSAFRGGDETPAPITKKDQ